MIKNASLSQLKDVHLPDPIGWWPLAPGWYGLIVIAIALILCLLIWGYRGYQPWKVKRQALLLLKQYQHQFKLDHDGDLACKQLSILLKRVALAYYPREQVAGLQGTSWLKFLNSTVKNQTVDFNLVEGELLLAPYQNNNKSLDVALLFKLVESWIKQRGKLCLN